MSCGLPSAPSGMVSMSFCFSSVSMARSGHNIAPGPIPFTLTLGASSVAKLRVNEASPDFARI